MKSQKRFMLSFTINWKMCGYRLACFLISICVIFKVNGQSKLDSLTLVLKTVKEDTNKVNILNAICVQYWQTGDFSRAKIYAIKALLSSNSIKTEHKTGWNKGKGNAYHNLGIIYNFLGNYGVALKENYAALLIRKAINDETGIANSYNNIAVVFTNQGNYSEALNNLFKALQIVEELNYKTEICDFSHNISSESEISGKSHHQRMTSRRNSDY